MSSLHRDPYENIYTVICGKKIFKLFPPTSRGKIIYKEFPVVRCHFNQSLRKWEKKHEKGIDSVKWIENGVDGVASEPMIVEVNPGETLYLPAGWFHQVHQEDNTIAVNYWYDRKCLRIGKISQNIFSNDFSIIKKSLRPALCKRAFP